jgi:hypothetical protein
MTREIKLHRAKVKYSWREILFAQVFHTTGFFDLTGNGRPVVGRNIELFNGRRILTRIAKLAICLTLMA